MGDANNGLCQAGPISFGYPQGWAVEDRYDEDGSAVMLQSEGVSFAIVGVYPADQEPDEIVGLALESLRGEHPDVEIEELPGAWWGDGAAAEAVFFSLDFIAYCWIRSGRLADRTLMVYMQTVEPEAAAGREAFETICRSIHAGSDKA
jgi:hypothetical protein